MTKKPTLEKSEALQFTRQKNERRKFGYVNGTLARLTMWQRFCRALVRDWQIWVLLAPTALSFLIFNYLPMYGVQIAFKDFRISRTIWGSDWVGLKHFTDFFKSYYAPRLILNTFLLNIYGLIFTFPAPIIMAILLNQVVFKRFKKVAQTMIYIPHFISTTVMVGILYLFLAPMQPDGVSGGIINKLITAFGGSSIYFMMEPGWFRPLSIITDVWQHAGWSTILFIAALTGIDQEMYEAASVDGANKRQKIWHIEIPHLIPIAVMMLILSCGSMLVSNTDKALLMQTSGNKAVSDIIGVYVYNMGLGGIAPKYSYTAAINLFINLVNFVIIIVVNGISRKVGETSLF